MGDESRVTQADRRANGPAERGVARLKAQLERAYETAVPDKVRRSFRIPGPLYTPLLYSTSPRTTQRRPAGAVSL
jgi:hypothetical protein